MSKTPEALWRDASKILQGMLNPELFSRWFAPIHVVELRDQTLVLGVANEFYQIWLQDNFLPLIRDTVHQVAGSPVQVRFAVAPAPAPAGNRPAAARAPSAPAATAGVNLKLNPRYTFETFVIGPNNDHAHAAALAVAQSPGKAYNPLFVYGGVGLGKTHLMQAIGHEGGRGRKGLRVCYITSEQFTNDFIQAIQTNSMIRFRKRYRQADLLLIDDIQFFAGKERMQEELFHTFNTLFDGHRQIVLSSDRPAAEIASLEDRLVSRFEWGLVAELQQPALETRIAILKKKAAALNVTVADSVVEFIAGRIRTNIRRLEGALIRVASYASLTGKEISTNSLESLLRDAIHEEARQTVTIDAIQRKVAEHFDIRLADMTSRRRPQNIAFPRQVAMFLSRSLTDRSLNDIGESFGGRDHGTVLHACRLIEARTRKDETLRQTVSYLEQALRR
ncbi:chromosomal replication initiator protein DnaA [bacterium]|nr:chromosomal replication initiator protein DnaA [bacterium]